MLVAVSLLSISGCSTEESRSPVSTNRGAASETTVNEICTVAAELMGVDRSQVKATTSLGDLGCDELDYVELIMELEDRFKVSIPDDAAESMLGAENWQDGMENVTMKSLADTVDKLRN